MGGAIGLEHFRGKRAASLVTGGNDGGNVDDILKRLTALETSYAAIRADLSAVVAVLPHLATKADFCSTKADIGGLRAEINALETAMIKWIIGTVISTGALAFAIAKFVS
jgi:hypothetical protein